MAGWLLDTNILSELRRLKPEPKVLAFIAAHPLEQFYVSAVIFAEIRFGIELVADASRRAAAELASNGAALNKKGMSLMV